MTICLILDTEVRTLINNIKKLRLEKGISKKMLAETVGIQPSDLEFIEERKLPYEPQKELMERIYAVLQSTNLSMNSMYAVEGLKAEPLDSKWMELVTEASQSNVSKEKFKEFLANKRAERWKLN